MPVLLDPQEALQRGVATPGVTGIADAASPDNSHLPKKTPGVTGVNDAAAKANGAKVDAQICVNHDAVTFPRDSAVKDIAGHEGYANYMYLDSKSIITIGTGWNLEASGSAAAPSATVLALPFVERKTGKPPADPDKSIKAAWAALRGISSSGTPQSAQATTFEKKTDLYIDDSKPDNVLAERYKQHIAEFTAGLQGMFKDFDSFPVPAREALLDMSLMGIGRSAVAAVKADKKKHIKARAGHKASGLHEFTRMIASVEAGDWKKAADQCNRPDVNKDRNDWTRARFLEAVGWACAKAG